jgi:hypothetical protein
MEKFELCIRDFKINLPQSSVQDDSTIASSNAEGSVRTSVDDTEGTNDVDDDDEDEDDE